MSAPALRIVVADLDDPRVQALLRAHLETSRANTAAGSAHALDLTGLRAPDVRVWTAWDDAELVGIGALRRLAPAHGEVKSMHTAAPRRRGGVGSAMLRHLIATARAEDMTRLSLETGSWAHFHPAVALYARHGFLPCLPFGDYRPDPNSVFMTLSLAGGGPNEDESGTG